MGHIARRDFLKAAPAAAAMVAYVAGETDAGPQATAAPKPAVPRISGTAYTPIPDYPIQPTRHSDVKMNDSFWKSRIATNAAVTIPFQVQKLTETEREFRALYERFRVENPPFSGTASTSIWAKHYLDIRGLANSVNRSRHNQSYKPACSIR